MIRYTALLILALLFSASVAEAASNDFHVRFNVSGDNTPPTTPSNLTATPITYSQIDLSWDPSTDDTLLAGYKVFRDTAQIGTTTLTTYSDTGLSSSTTYSYYVKAYDSVFNVSSSSAIVSTTTNAFVATSTPTTTKEQPQSSGPRDMTLQSFSIVPSLYSAQVTWQTSQYAQFELWWGRTSSYELGFVTNDLFKRADMTSITDLHPGTVYEYQLVAYYKNGVRTVISHGEFKTLDAPDTTAPANVSDLHAEVQGGDVRLSWINPRDADFSYVRIIRNYLFYPTDPYDGFIAYQDKGTSYLDSGVLDPKGIEYYTVFSYDTNGNVSSGATVEVRSPGYPEPPLQEAASSTPLRFSDISFMQDGEAVSPSGINADSAVTIRIPYEKLPEHLKTVQALFTGSDGSFNGPSFLLRINKDKSYYEATVGALHDSGSYPLRIIVYDYQQETLTSLDGSITVVHTTTPMSGGLTAGKKPNITPLDILLLGVFLSTLSFALYRALQNMNFEQALLGHFTRTKITASVLLFFIFGGSCAYILQTLLRVGTLASSLPSSHHSASVSMSQSSSAEDLLPAAAILLITVLVVLGVSLVKGRSKK